MMETDKKSKTSSKEEKSNITQKKVIVTQKKMITDKVGGEKKIKKSILLFLVISFSIILLIACAFLVFMLIKKKKRKIEEENESNEINESKNINKIKNVIYAVYEVKDGEKMSFFNLNEKNDLKEEDIYIKEKSFISNNLRNLENLEINGNFYTPSHNGLLSVEIKFKKHLNNLENFFLNNKELISVNMSNFEMKEVTSMKSTFRGCSNLQEVNFEGNNAQNLKNLDNTFENCTKLKNVNLSINNMSNIEEASNTFSGCENLESINITTFQNIKDGMFNNIKSTPTIIANEYISNDITKIFFNINIKINIIIVIIEPRNECNLGDGEKCKTCSKINKKNCLTCNSGYYLPFNAINTERCSACNIIEHCLSCFGSTNSILCLSCGLGYNLENNKCVKDKIMLPNCTIGDNELCKVCNSNEDLRNECEACNEGFYLPVDAQNKSFCENCNKIENCIECSGIKNNPICSKCLNGFKLVNNSCIEELCIIGEKEKCKTCRNELNRKKECGSCNEGYYIFGDKNFQCLKCSIKNCKKCSIKLGEEICEKCNDNFELSTDKSCICSYNLINDNICQKYENWIEAEYNISDNKSVFDFQLLDQGNPPYINLNEIDMYINGTKIPILLYYSSFYYNFSQLGIYKIAINIKKSLYYMNNIFMNIHTLKKITFLESFDASKVRDMSYMFCGCNVEIIDMKHLKTDNLINLKYFLWGATSLHTLLLSNSFDTSKVTNMETLFYANRALKEIDLSYFDTSKVSNCIYMFYEFPIYTIIKISNKFTKCREFIPYINKVINIDEISCKNFEHCKECIGSKDTLSCSLCEIGYELKDNICIQSKCIVGEENKCTKCQIIQNKENECLTCNEGYYLPLNSLVKTNCEKCKIEGCKICDENNGNCKECKLFYNPIFDQNSEYIISCELLCHLGDKNLCATCNMEKGKEYQCSSCNQGYKLMKDGSCKKIENSFTAIYNITSISTPTPIMKQKLGHIDMYPLDLSDIDAYINGIKISIVMCNYHYFCYTFENLGLIEVKIIFNKTLDTLEEIFYYLNNLIEVNFSETFDTSHTLTIEGMFMDCHSLRSVNLSSFNTTLVCEMSYLFEACYELTSIDLSNFNTTNVLSFHHIFLNTKKLNYIDISSFNVKANTHLFETVAPNGTLIINKNIYNGDIPNGWNIIYKE